MLKHVFPIAGCLLVQLIVGVGVAEGQAKVPAASVGADSLTKEMRANADTFVAAFAKRDAAAIAAQWTSDGVYIDEAGQKFAGRKAIQAEYETLFKDAPSELAMRIEIDSVRLVSADTAIEEGRSALVPQPPGASRVMSRYTAVHVKQDGRWLIAELRDSRLDLPPDSGQLSDLGWLVGTWSASNGDTSVAVKCRWVENNRFLLRTNAVTEAGKSTAGGLEVIGIHPSTQRITSWFFTNDGGHSVGVWNPMQGSWAVESVGVLEEGTVTTATNILSRSKDDELMWKSVERTVGDATLPDVAEVVLKRQ
jgi:uncharacterized protein (TIGR02246 family)